MICKWIKRSMITVVGLGAASYFFFGSHALSYVSTAASELRNSVRGEIPIEFELKRAEDLIQEIGPQIKRTRLDVARAEVRRDALATEILELEQSVQSGERKLRNNSVLIGGNGQARFQLAGKTWTHERIKIDLAQTFDRFRQNSTMLKAKKVHFKKQNASVQAATRKLDAIRAEESRLQDMIGALKTQKAQLDAMAAASHSLTPIDDGALGKAKAVLTEVKERLAIAQKMLADDEFFQEGIEADVFEDRDIVGEIRDYFGGESGSAKTSGKLLKIGSGK